MKTILFALIMCIIGVTACNRQTTNCVCKNHESWMAYCRAYNVNPENPTVEQSDYYLDCWVGSIEEEKSLTQ